MQNIKVSYKKLFGFGALIWLVAYMTASVFVAYDMVDAFMSGLVIITAVAIAAFFAGRNLAVGSFTGMLKYSVSWVVIGLVLDAIFTVPFTSWEIFAAWHVWVGYAFILLIPLLAVKEI